MLQGPELRELARYSGDLLARVKKIPGVVDADTTLNVGKPEMSVRIDRPKAADLGAMSRDERLERSHAGGGSMWMTASAICG